MWYYTFDKPQQTISGSTQHLQWTSPYRIHCALVTRTFQPSAKPGVALEGEMLSLMWLEEQQVGDGSGANCLPWFLEWYESSYTEIDVLVCFEHIIENGPSRSIESVSVPCNLETSRSLSGHCFNGRELS